MTERKRRRRAFTGMGAAAGVLLAAGCGNGMIGDPGTSCVSTRDYFLTEVWGPVMSRTCAGCHAQGGTAMVQGARFQLLPGSYPDFAEANLAAVRSMITQSYQVNGQTVPALLAKPSQAVMHGGGVQAATGSHDYQVLAELVRRLQAEGTNANTCPDYGSTTVPSGVALQSWATTLRRVALDQVGRLPTAQELAAVTDQASFERVVLAMMDEDAWYNRWRTAWNDLLLTDRWVSTDGCDQRALNLINNVDFPNRGQYGGGATAGLDCCNRDRMNTMCDSVRTFFLNANNAIAREPINLFEYVVRNNRPFSEVLTANYTIVNPQSAFVYGVSSQVGYTDNYASPTDLRVARLQYTRHYAMDQVTVDFPHAGVLTTAAFLGRYPTTTTNRNRHRARIVQSYFLATDILRVGERPLDPTSADAVVTAPTLNYGPCVTCHTINDPIAGAFRGFVPNDSAWRFDPRDPWYQDMFPPGFNGERMPSSSYGSALQWLGTEVSQDPRFVTSVVRFIYTSLARRDALQYPTDANDPQYAQRAAAWTEQDRLLRGVAQRFVASGMNFRQAVLAMLESPIYRAEQLVMPANSTDAQRAQHSNAHAGLGTAMLVSPENLDQRIRAIAGFGWVRDQARDATQGRRDGWLTNDLYLQYGGINSDTIVSRARDASGIITGVQSRMANMVACAGSAWDFTRPAAQRRFFPRVELATVPEAGGNTVPGNVALIRQNIADLHQLILGETLDPNSDEVGRTYQLFLDTWREVTASPEALMAWDYSCRGTKDPTTGMDLPMAQRLPNDNTGVVRAWTAVVAYLFSDYRFLYQ